MSGLAATLREAEPGTRIRLVLDDGREVGGIFRGVNGEAVALEDKRVELKQVKRLYLEFGSASKGKAAASSKRKATASSKRKATA